MKAVKIGLLCLVVLSGVSAVYAEEDQISAVEVMSFGGLESPSSLLFVIGGIGLIFARRYHKHH